MTPPRPSVSVWPAPPVGAWRAGRVRMPAFPLAVPGGQLYGRGRHGLLAVGRALGLGPGDEVLVPAYHHGSEVEAVCALGCRPRFYGAADPAVPDPAELDDLRTPATRALLLVHYLGFPQDAPAWREFCDARGLLLVEDAAQAWLAHVGGRPVGSYGDGAVFCLYKTLGLADGAAGVARPGLPAPPRGSRGLAPIARRVAAGVLPGAVRARLAPARYDADADFRATAVVGPTTVSRLLLERAPTLDIAAHRRANHASLVHALGPHVLEPFRAIPDGASPLCVPIVTPEKQQLLARLADAGIDALDFWSVPHPRLDPARFPAAARWRATVVGLPVHQRLRPQDLERIAGAVQAAIGSEG